MPSGILICISSHAQFSPIVFRKAKPPLLPDQTICIKRMQTDKTPKTWTNTGQIQCDLSAVCPLASVQQAFNTESGADLRAKHQEEMWDTMFDKRFNLYAWSLCFCSINKGYGIESPACECQFEGEAKSLVALLCETEKFHQSNHLAFSEWNYWSRELDL